MGHNASNDNDKEKVYYVGDSRVRANSPKLSPPDYSQFKGKDEAFFPDFLLREWMVAAIFLVGFMTLVMYEPAPIGEIADPGVGGFVPVPDWYFLFLYQILKYKWAAGQFVLIGTVVLPGIAFTALLLAPWLDQSPVRNPLKRPLTSSIMLLSIVCLAALTWIAEDEHIKQLVASSGAVPLSKEVIAKEDKGYQIYKQSACITCHGENLEGKKGLSLLGVGDRLKGEHKLTRQEISQLIDKGRGYMPAGMFQGTPAEKEILLDWLMKQKQK